MGVSSAMSPQWGQGWRKGGYCQKSGAKLILYLFFKSGKISELFRKTFTTENTPVVTPDPAGTQEKPDDYDDKKTDLVPVTPPSSHEP